MEDSPYPERIAPSISIEEPCGRDASRDKIEYTIDMSREELMEYLRG